MDRQIVYNGQLPLETDVLNTNIYAMIALGRLAMDILGTNTLASGLACTPTAPASMSVKIGAGALYSLKNIDDTAYSSLPANTVDQIMKQGIVKTADAVQLTMTAPTTSGYSIIYLIEAAYQDTDSGNTVLNYYDAANPAVPYTGPNNSNASQPTNRAGKVAIQLKAGVSAASPVAPSVDSGYVPLYYVTVANGQTTIVSGNIAVATGAPFIPTTLTNLAPLASPAFTGSPTAPTKAQFNSSTGLATTAFVMMMLGNYTGTISYSAGSVTQPASDFGKIVLLQNASTATITTPSFSGVPLGATLTYSNYGAAVQTLQTTGPNFQGNGFAAASTFTLPPGQTMQCVYDGTSLDITFLTGNTAPIPTAATGAGQWRAVIIGASTVTLPAGGTWAYFASNNGNGVAGIAAGGSTIISGTLNNAFGFCWRIA